jgi:hypothetical protein
MKAESERKSMNKKSGTQLRQKYGRAEKSEKPRFSVPLIFLPSFHRASHRVAVSRSDLKKGFRRNGCGLVQFARPSGLPCIAVRESRVKPGQSQSNQFGGSSWRVKSMQLL